MRLKGTGKLLILFYIPLETKAATALLAGELVMKVMVITAASGFAVACLTFKEAQVGNSIPGVSSVSQWWRRERGDNDSPCVPF